MALTRILSSGIDSNITLSNVIVTGTLTNNSGVPFVTSGTMGYTGSVGVGYTGSAGANGTIGIDGYTGSKGDIGYTGSAGANGTIGIDGYTGSKGDIGYAGSAGVGYTGSIGTGYTGSAGVGYTGSAGSQGSIGYTGSAGTGGGGGSGYTGSQGLPGSLASGVVTDAFTGNGVQTAFTLSVSPLNENQTIVNIDGVTQQRTSYTVSGYTLTLDEAPLADEVIEVTTLAYGATSFVTRNYTGDGTTTTYTVTSGITADALIISLNGVIQRPTTDYIVYGTNLIFAEAPSNGDIITVREIPSGAIGGTSIYSRTSVTATAGQTSFDVAYNIGYLEVYFNGALLNAVDYTATNGANVVLTDAATAGDIVEFITYNVVPIGVVPVATFNSTNLTANLAITAGYSAVSVGPINIADGVIVSIAAGQKWVIL